MPRSGGKLMPFYRHDRLGVIHMRGTKLPAPCSERLLLDGKPVMCLYPSLSA